MNTDQLLFIRVKHDGEAPASWAKGSEEFQKAKVIAAFAWAATKHPDDPLLQHCDLTHQETCTAVVQSILGGNKPDDTAFALKAAEIIKQIEEKTNGYNQITNRS